MYVSAAACTRSQCRQISQPPPSASPAGAATTGTGDIFSADVARWNVRTIRSTSSQLPSCASMRSSARFAPAEKMIGFGADDERREVPRGLVDAGEDHLHRVAAERVQLRVELDAEDAVAEIDEARARVLLHDARRRARRAQHQRARIDRRQSARPERLSTGVAGARLAMRQAALRLRCRSARTPSRRSERPRRSRPTSRTGRAASRSPSASRDPRHRSSRRSRARRGRRRRVV